MILHVAPARPEALVPILLAADLAEHHGPRESLRAGELADAWFDALRQASREPLPS